MDQGEEKQRHPITGEPYDEEAERKRLTAIDSSPENDEKIKLAFLKFSKTGFQEQFNSGEVVQVKPEELFLSFKTNTPNNLCFRQYFRKPEDTSPFGMWHRIKTLQVSDALFTKMTHGRKNIRIEHQGEQSISRSVAEGTQMDMLRFIISDEDCFIEANIQGRELNVHYDQAGKIRYMRLSTTPDSAEDFSIPSDQINAVLKSKHFEEQKKGQKYNLSVVSNEEGDQIQLKRRGNNNNDDIVIPCSINVDGIYEHLIPRPLAENPSSAPLELDINWKNTSLSTFGINWQRS